MQQDNIADMFTRIRNGQMTKSLQVEVVKSNINLQIASLLCKEGYIKSFQDDPKNFKTFTIQLKYYKNQPVIESIKRVSRNGCRIYTNVRKMPSAFANLGILIISTSQGIMTGKESKRLNVGGEIIGEVY